VIGLIGCPVSGSAPVTGQCSPECSPAVTGTYSSPASDPAPWYDPACPESANFAGFYTTKFEGLESTYTREVFPVIGGGGILGRLRAGPRSLIWSGFLFGKTCCGVAYGLRWLTNTLAQSRCGAECSGEQLDLMVCCPQKEIEAAIAAGAAAEQAAIAAPEDNLWMYGGWAYGEAEYAGANANSGATQTEEEIIAGFGDTAFRSLYNVGLVEGPLVLGERKSSCGCGCAAIMEIEFTLVAGNPHFYRQPVVLADCVPFPLASEEECPWVDSSDPNDCPPPAECPEPEPCTMDPNCPSPTLPIIITESDECVCTPFQPVETCVAVPASTWGCSSEAVPIFQVSSGDQPIYSTEIRIIQNSIGRTCDELSEDPCLSCTTIGIRFIPANSTLVIDGVNRRITIECAGGEVQPGEPFLTGSFEWPVFSCSDYCVCATVDGLTASEDACFSMSVVPREM
jgi:hypothetical protein